MSEAENKNTEKKTEQEQTIKPLTLGEISKGTLILADPIRAHSEDLKELHYDFSRLTGWEYADAMDTDTTARNIFTVTRKQALCLFAAAAAKATPEVDATDVKQRLGVADAQRAVQIAMLFLTRAAREAGSNTYGE